MQGFIDVEIEGDTVKELSLMSNRGIQVLNPRRCRLNFYYDETCLKSSFCMREGMYAQVYQNLNIAGVFYIKAIGLAVGEKIIITINLM